eukprot:13766843-Alexandrium_andersonii.AAC.1
MYLSKVSHAMLFVDLESVYDRSLRQRLFGSSDFESLEIDLAALKLPQETIQATKQLIAEQGSLCQEAGVPSWVATLLDSHHDGAWVLPRGAPSRVTTLRG